MSHSILEENLNNEPKTCKIFEHLLDVNSVMQQTHCSRKLDATTGVFDFVLITESRILCVLGIIGVPEGSWKCGWVNRHAVGGGDWREQLNIKPRI